ncbi:MAG: hypothetical protein CMF25_00200 [Kangiellaceae bacterium]|jgi:hypothetical protein|nr:hypothetical protein [Kangiellaceae bacterium]|tara:strand:- start:2936 stop:3754 length:819 start_codon:yes stop_codon:yes gene_type:complete
MLLHVLWLVVVGVLTQVSQAKGLEWGDMLDTAEQSLPVMTLHHAQSGEQVTTIALATPYVVRIAWNSAQKVHPVLALYGVSSQGNLIHEWNHSLAINAGVERDGWLQRLDAHSSQIAVPVLFTQAAQRVEIVMHYINRHGLPYSLVADFTMEPLNPEPVFSASPVRIPPEVELVVDESAAGQISTIELRSHALSGLKSSWFWVVRLDQEGPMVQPAMGRWIEHRGAIAAYQRFRVVFADVGEYQICARSRDLLYPARAISQSPVDCVEVVIE